MRKVFSCALIFFVVLFLVNESFAQTRRSRSRRTTRAPQTAPDTNGVTNDGEPALVSSADDGNNTSQDANAAKNASRSRKTATPTDTDAQQLRKTVERLSTQVDRLSTQLKDMRDEQGALVNMDRLSNAEQRAENLHSQLRDLQEKEASVQARLEQVDYDMQPDNLNLRLATIGTLQPDKVRENLRLQLERERTRLSNQLNSLTASRQRLEATVADADAQVDRLRARLSDLDNAQNAARVNAMNNANNTTGTSNTSNTNAPNTSISPTNAESVPSSNNNQNNTQNNTQSPPPSRVNTSAPPR